MKNAKYLLVIAAFATLAFVGFSAFTAPSGNIDVAGKGGVVEAVIIYGVAESDAATGAINKITWGGGTRSGAELSAKSKAVNSTTKIYFVVEGYKNPD